MPPCVKPLGDRPAAGASVAAALGSGSHGTCGSVARRPCDHQLTRRPHGDATTPLKPARVHRPCGNITGGGRGDESSAAGASSRGPSLQPLPPPCTLLQPSSPGAHAIRTAYRARGRGVGRRPRRLRCAPRRRMDEGCPLRSSHHSQGVVAASQRSSSRPILSAERKGLGQDPQREKGLGRRDSTFRWRSFVQPRGARRSEQGAPQLFASRASGCALRPPAR